MHMAPRAAAWVAWAAWTCNTGPKRGAQADESPAKRPIAVKKAGFVPAFFCPSEMRVRRHSKIRYNLANDRYPGTLDHWLSRTDTRTQVLAEPDRFLREHL
jgi:hypothetical protein